MANANELSIWYREFVDAIPSSSQVAEHLERVSAARETWRRHWRARAEADDPAKLFAKLFPHVDGVANENVWTHPVGDDADELRPWLSRCFASDPSERASRVASALEVLTRVERQPDAGPRSIETRALRESDIPLAAMSAALSALSPERCVPLCRAWVRVLGRSGGKRLSETVDVYGELNALALDWLEREERRSPSSALVNYPVADRVSSFFGWAVRDKRAALSRATFSVNRDGYKDWPPMW